MQINAKAATRPLTVRVAVWSAGHHRLVLGLWLVFTIGLFMTGNAMGTKVREINGESDAYPTLEAGKAWEVFKADGSQAAPQTMVIVLSHPTLKISDPTFKEVTRQLSESLRQATFKDNGNVTPVFTQITDYYTTGMPFLISKDASTTQILATLNDKTARQSGNLKAVDAVIRQIATANQSFEVHTLNTSLLLSQLIEVVTHDMDSSLKLTLPATLIILLIAFGAIGAAVIPLALAVTSLLGAFGLLAIYSNLVSPVDFSSSQLIGLIGLAVGIDYSLFMITRYRSERRKGREKLAAIEVASSTAGRAVFFSGVTVMISLAGLYLMGDASFNATATGTIAVVAVSVIGSLTFLPATLAILGNGINWGRIPYFGRERAEGSGFWSKMVKLVMQRPAAFAILTVVALLVLSYPVLHLRLGVSGVESFPESVEGVQAIKLLNQKWPEGTTLKVYTFVTGADRPATQAALVQFQNAALQVKGLNGPAEIITSGGGKVSYLTLYMTGTRGSADNKALVEKLRKELVPAYFGNLKDVQVYISGDAAFSVDIVKLYYDKTPLVVGFVLGLSFLLLLVAFRSIVIPIKAIVLNFLSLGASYGAMVLVFQEGWFKEQLGFVPNGQIESFLPLFMFTILFGLSMDYHLLILTRIKEARDHGASSNEAVAKGISVTSGTITSAAAIMVVVFSVFVTLQLISVRQMGFGLAVAVFVDATIIRSVLLPATMRLLGNWNWWLPKFLDWLPHITIEAGAEDLPVMAQDEVNRSVESILTR